MKVAHLRAVTSRRGDAEDSLMWILRHGGQAKKVAPRKRPGPSPVEKASRAVPKDAPPPKRIERARASDVYVRPKTPPKLAFEATIDVGRELQAGRKPEPSRMQVLNAWMARTCLEIQVPAELVPVGRSRVDVSIPVMAASSLTIAASILILVGV